MIHLIAPTEHPIDDRMLRGMFAARKQVFVDLLKWDVPVIAETYEVDQFDDTHARYLVLSDASGGHLASTRLLPTARPHILDSLFPQLCDDKPPPSRDVTEITRFCLDRSLDARGRRQVRNALVTALVDHAQATGIRAYRAVAEIGWFQQIIAFGWRCRPLGLPQVVNGSMLVALEIDIRANTRAQLVAAGIAPPLPTIAKAA